MEKKAGAAASFASSPGTLAACFRPVTTTGRSVYRPFAEGSQDTRLRRYSLQRHSHLQEHQRRIDDFPSAAAKDNNNSSIATADLSKGKSASPSADASIASEKQAEWKARSADSGLLPQQAQAQPSSAGGVCADSGSAVERSAMLRRHRIGGLLKARRRGSAFFELFMGPVIGRAHKAKTARDSSPKCPDEFSASPTVSSLEFQNGAAAVGEERQQLAAPPSVPSEEWVVSDSPPDWQPQTALERASSDKGISSGEGADSVVARGFGERRDVLSERWEAAPFCCRDGFPGEGDTAASALGEEERSQLSAAEAVSVWLHTGSMQGGGEDGDWASSQELEMESPSQRALLVMAIPHGACVLRSMGGEAFEVVADFCVKNQERRAETTNCVSRGAR